MLHITNGDATADILRRSSLGGEIVPFREALIAGPTPDGVEGEKWIALRAAFLATEYNVDAAECAAGLREMEQTLLGLDTHDEVTLWFEHDLFCQVNLLYLLDRIRTIGALPARLSLVMIGSFPGIDNFRGLGELGPANLEMLFAQRTPIGEPQLELAGDAWKAYRSGDPSAIRSLLDRDTTPLPYLHEALILHLKRFPSTFNGLGAVERTALTAIAAGATTFAALFREFSAAAPGYGYGDLQLWGDLARLSKGIHSMSTFHPLLAVTENTDDASPDKNPLYARSFQLTDAGRDVLSGREDAIALNGIDRWLGGAHLISGTWIWRWDGK
jgi:hypothetical protein